MYTRYSVLGCFAYIGISCTVLFAEDADTIDDDDDDEEMELSQFMELPASHRIASGLGIDARDMQLRKASLFGSDELPVEGERVGTK